MIRDIPPATVGIIALCTLLHVLQLVLDVDLHKVTMCPRLVLYLHEYYRILSSTLFHGDLMHVGMNMVSTAAIGRTLEKHSGTLRQLVTILWSMLLTSTVFVLVALVSSACLGIDDIMYQHALGFSGVLFHLSILECNLAPGGTRSIFGFFTVPSYLYPVALLVALQMFMPNLSFTGHLAGIFTGTLQLYGALEPITVSDAHLREMESWNSLRWLTSRAGFVMTPAASESAGRGDFISLRQGIYRACRTVSTLAAHVLETVQVIIFGRGRDVNSNIQLPVWDSPLSSSPIMASDDVEEDEEWVGLPTLPTAAHEHDADSRML